MAEEKENKEPRVIIVFPSQLAFRDVMETPIIELLAKKKEIKFHLLTHFSEDEKKLSELGADNIEWANVRRPVNAKEILTIRSFFRLIKKLLFQSFLLLTLGRAKFGNLVYRFNNIHQFVGHKQKANLPPKRRKREALAGNYVDRKYGVPFPKSRLLFQVLYRLYYSKWDADLWVEAFFDSFKPDLVVFWYVQNQIVKPYSIAASRRGLHTLGVIGSWDRLTTKGPLCPNINDYLVSNRVMKRELIEHHGISEEKIQVMGWPRMDLYKKTSTIVERSVFLKSIGVSENRRLLVLAANGERLGAHEPSMARNIAKKLKENKYGFPCTLIVRPHPKDGRWQERFGNIDDPPEVMVQPAEWGRLEYMTNLFYHADILFASSGTAALDAVGLDTCTINIGFDGDMKRDYYESIERWYDLDHYSAVIRSGGTRLVRSYEEMDTVIIDYLKNPEMDDEGRKRLRDELLEPFDGRASERFVDFFVQRARLGM